MCAMSRHAIFRLTPVIADHFLCPTLIAACSYQPSIHVSRLQSSSITLIPQSMCQDYSLLPSHSSLNPQPSLNSNLLISTLNPCVKITVCFHYTHPSIHVSKLQPSSFTFNPQNQHQDYSLLPLHSTLKTSTKITVCFHYIHIALI